MKKIKALLLSLMLLVSTVTALTCEEWDWHKDYVSSFYCITWNGETYMSDVRVPPNGNTPPNSDLWQKCVIVGNSCLTDSVLVANQCKTSDTIKISVNVYDTITSVVWDTLRTRIDLFDTTATEIFKYDTIVQNVIKLDTLISEVTIYDTINVVTTKFDTTYSQVTKIDTIPIRYNIFDTLYVAVHDTFITMVELSDTVYKVDTIAKLDTTTYSILDSFYINNKYFSSSTITKKDLSKTPILITTIDTTVISITRFDIVVLYYDLYLYDSYGQFINHVKGQDTLAIFGEFKSSEISLLDYDKNGYLISDTGRRLANGVVIIKGHGTLKINENIKSTYNYNSIEGYRRSK